MLSTLLRPLHHAWLALLAPRMRYGVRSGCGAWRPHSRIGSHTQVLVPERLVLGDHVFIGQFNLLDASGGLTLGTGCQVTSHCTLLTHGSHRALRLAREAYWGAADPPGMERGPVVLGDWCFVGAHSTLLPGTTLGRGVLVRAYSLVRGAVPDFAVVQGQPARVVGDVRERDRAWLDAHPGVLDAAARAAYDAWAAGVSAVATGAPRA